MERFPMARELAHDIRIASRGLMRVPVLALTIVLTVGVGLGATAAIFSAVDAALLQPLPYVTPERLVRIHTDAPPFKWRFSVADYLAFREQQTHFEQSATFTDRSVIHTAGSSSEVLQARVVSWAFFSVLGIPPVLGRDFSEEDGRPGTPGTVIASHGFWQQRLGARPDAIGKPIELDGTVHTLIGVLPPRSGPLERRPALFLIQQFSPPSRRGPFLYTVVAKLRDDADRSVALAELRAISKRIFPIWKSSYQDDRASWAMEDLKTTVVGDSKPLAALALVCVAMVWLIACANASNLLIARVTSRRQELAVRTALGASRARVVGHLLVESSVLAAGALGLGVLVAWLGIDALHGVGSTYFPRTQEIAINARVISVLLALAVCSGLMFGLIPALQGPGGSIDTSLTSMGRSSTAAPGTRRLRHALVGAQFAIATPLLIFAGLLLGSLNQLKSVDVGFDVRNLVTGSVRLPAAQYGEPGRTKAFWDELTRRVAALPDVAGVAFADGLPPDGVGNINNFDLEQFPTPPGESQPATAWVAVTPDYFRVLGLRLLEGRLLDPRDVGPEGVEAVVVDRPWAHRFFPNESAIGKRFKEGGCTACPWTTVVGVVSEAKYLGLERPDEGTVYYPANDSDLSRFLVVRTRVDPARAMPALQRVVRGLDPSAPLSAVATMEDLVARSIDSPRSLSQLVAALGIVALVLAVVGIYGVMGHYVQQHLREIGIRTALGGTPAAVLRVVLGHGMRVVAAGVLCGVVAAFVLAPLASSLLFGINATHAMTFASASGLLLSIAFAACFLPARRAVNVPPAVVLRNE